MKSKNAYATTLDEPQHVNREAAAARRRHLSFLDTLLPTRETCIEESNTGVHRLAENTGLRAY